MNNSEFLLSIDRLKNLPEKPGVYLMKDEDGKVLYVGKAKNLKNRVRSYFSGQDDRYNVQFLLTKVKSVATVITVDERQALVLEADLIRKHKPKYNIRLKDDKAYLMVRVDLNEEWPKIDLVRSEANDGAKYYGPFAFGYDLRVILELIKKTFPLRTCSNNIFRNRVRPCIEYQIKRCSGPCCIAVDREKYLEWVDGALKLLSGKNKEVVKNLETQMQLYSEDLNFEEAAVIRDRIAVINKFSGESSKGSFSENSQDAFGFYRSENKAELVILVVRRGRIFEVKNYNFNDVFGADEEFLESILTQYYQSGAEVPEQVLLPKLIEDLEVRENILAEKRKAKVKIIFPKVGSKSRLIALAEANAKENFSARFNSSNVADKILSELAKELDLEEIPRIIECADISHFQGKSTVGSVVSFKDAFPDKTRYRHFILSNEQNDDFASMREVVGRHLSRAAEENTLPDLLVIDGGPAQLAQALKMRKELSLTRPVIVSIAKKRARGIGYRASNETIKRIKEKKPERLFLEDRDKAVILAPGSKSLNLIEKLRNEAHRFAITFHRSRRAKRIFTTNLDVIPGVGKRRRNLLLKEFGSVKLLSKVEAEEISARCNIPLALAKRILFYLNRPEK
ncbi:MAG: excinuclease ABC subunit UvrC [Proteobacteria bacterium]|nr:excinuclease ABC subunit UvrC [Pseudomonadota bacterium]